MSITRKSIPDREVTVPSLEDRYRRAGVEPAELKKLIADLEEAVDERKPIGRRIKAFVRGESRAGRSAGALLDIAQVLLPGGVRTGRQAAQLLINRKEQPPMKKAIKRALTSDGGGFLRVRDEDGNLDGTAIAATAIRLVLILGLFYGANALGLNPAEIWTFITGL
jgi:hypothetical protein